MADAIRTERLTKSYGQARGIVDLDLCVPSGEIFGFLGPNGAGKTTTMRILLDLIRPTSGSATVLGLDSQKDSVEIRRHTGYLPGELALYDRLTGRELLSFLGGLRGRLDSAYAAALATRFSLDLDRPIRALSKGNRQKLGLLQAVVHRPRLLILDEPTSGLDPLVQHEFHQLLAEVVADGGTILLSSHVLSEVEHVADRVGIIRAGRLVAVEDVEGLKARAVRRFDVRFVSRVPRQALESVPGVRRIEVHGPTARLVLEGSPDALIKALGEYEIADLRSHEPDLEEVFLAYYAEETPRAA